VGVPRGGHEATPKRRRAPRPTTPQQPTPRWAGWCGRGRGAWWASAAVAWAWCGHGAGAEAEARAVGTEGTRVSSGTVAEPRHVASGGRTHGGWHHGCGPSHAGRGQLEGWRLGGAGGLGGHSRAWLGVLVASARARPRATVAGRSCTCEMVVPGRAGRVVEPNMGVLVGWGSGLFGGVRHLQQTGTCILQMGGIRCAYGLRHMPQGMRVSRRLTA